MSQKQGLLRVNNLTRNSCLGEQIEVADTTMRRIVGLLGRQSLASGSGLFIVPTQAIHTIGMAFPIDVVFVDRKYKVVGLCDSLAPLRLSGLHLRALGVIELPAGTIRSTGTQLGDHLAVAPAEVNSQEVASYASL